MTAGGGEHDQDYEGRSQDVSEAGGRSEAEDGEVRVECSQQMSVSCLPHLQTGDSGGAY